MAASMVTSGDYVAGWLDCPIHDFLQVLTPTTTIKYVLMTCLDSNPNPAALRSQGPELKSIAANAEVRGSGLLFPTDSLLKADSRKRIFFGFDELWFFPTKGIQTNPPPLSLVGPARLNQPRLKRLARWMSRESCSLALGGGDGLNFIVRARGLVRLLLGSSIRQPESALAST